MRPPLCSQAALSSSRDPSPEPGSGVQGQGCVGLGMAHTGSWMASRGDGMQRWVLVGEQSLPGREVLSKHVWPLRK